MADPFIPKPELPRERSVFWNVSFVGTLLLALLLTQVYAGGPWQDIAVIFGGAISTGTGLGAATFLAGHHRDPWRRYQREQAKATQPVRPIHIAAATGESA
jgi:predicted membrane-bound mannosyltransferase